MPYLGFQLDEKTEFALRDELGGKYPYCKIRSKEIEWAIPEDQEQKYLDLVNLVGFDATQFNKVDEDTQGGYVKYYVRIGFDKYDDFILVLDFLTSGLVGGFLLKSFSYKFSDILLDLNFLVNISNKQEKEEAIKKIASYPLKDSFVCNFLGKLQLDIEDTESAAKSFAESSEKNEFYAEPFSNLGSLLWQNGDKEKAFHLFCEALLRCPYNVNIQDNFIQAGLELGNHLKMYETINHVEKFYPEYPDLLFLKAILAQKLDNKEEALKIIEKYLDLVPDDERAKELFDEISSNNGGDNQKQQA